MNPATNYQEEIKRLKEELQLRQEQIYEYLGLDRRVQELEEELQNANETIMIQEGMIVGQKEQITELVAHNHSLKDEIDKLAKDGEDNDSEIRELEDEIRYLETKLENEKEEQLKTKTRIWEIITGRVETGYLSYKKYGNRTIMYSPEIPEDWEDFLQMLRRHAWEKK